MNDQPNVVCISIDSVRADEVSFISHKGKSMGKSKTTPNLNRLAEKSIVFKRAVSPSTWTLPVHASIFTGLYPPEHGVLDHDIKLGDHPTLGELLKEEGYETKSFYYNSWLGIDGILDGFERQRDPSEAGLDISGRRIYIHRLLARLNIAKQIYHLYSFRKRPQEDKETVRLAIKELKKASKPFCYFIHLHDTHWQYLPPKSLENRFSDASRISLRWNLYWQYKMFGNRENCWTQEWVPKESITRRMKELYRACIFQADSLIGDLLNTLEEQGYMDNTIIIVFGDHGDNFDDDGLYGHQFSVSNGLIQVPLLIYDPTNQLESEKYRSPANLNDLYPTVLNLCNIDPPSTHSINLVSNKRTTAYTYFHLVDGGYIDSYLDDVSDSQIPPKRQYVAWRSESEKAIWYPDSDTYEGPSELAEDILVHFNSLDLSIDNRYGEINEEVRANLEQMGYL